jgi:lipopolysaccharide assembly outer membrane protein LptD (OstA)
LILTCNHLPWRAWDRKVSCPQSIKQEQPPNESQWPDSMSDISAIEQRRIGKHELRATGEVKMRYQDMLLKADEVWGNTLTQDVEGQGKVYFEQGQQKIWGERFKFNLRTKMGSFYQVKGRADPGFIFEAAEVEKIGDDKYRVKDGFVTACEDTPPSTRTDSASSPGP